MGKRDFNFTCRGKSGDRIYGLPVVRSLGGGAVHGVKEYEKTFYKKQPYITGATCKHVKKATLLWGYSIPLRLHKKIDRTHPKETLVESHFISLGLKVPKNIIPWLIADRLNVTYPIIVHRTTRYHNNVNLKFLKHFRGDLYCVGFYHEVKPFIKQYQAKWLKAKDLNELATIINSCQVFIGNQSTPLALAAGLGKNRLIEECHPKNRLFKNTPGDWWANCTFGSKNEGILTGYKEINYLMVKSLLDNKPPRAPIFI